MDANRICHKRIGHSNLYDRKNDPSSFEHFFCNHTTTFPFSAIQHYFRSYFLTIYNTYITDHTGDLFKKVVALQKKILYTVENTFVKRRKL